MNPTQAFYIRVSAVTGCLAVIIGAFGAHGLEAVLSEEMKTIYETGVKYHFYHALAMLAVCMGPASLWERNSTRWALRMFLIGIIVFSGSLYVLAITEIKWLGAITPIGGTAMIAGWLLLIPAANPTGGKNG